jgi:hypothetical protein
MSDAVEKHLDKAFASLDDVPVRELDNGRGARASEGRLARLRKHLS